VLFVGYMLYAIVISNQAVRPLQAEAPSLADRDKLAKRESGISDSSSMRLRMEALVREKQKEIVREIEKVDGKKFQIDEWQRATGAGGGISCVLQDGNVFEKAGVNITIA